MQRAEQDLKAARGLPEHADHGAEAISNSSCLDLERKFYLFKVPVRMPFILFNLLMFCASLVLLYPSPLNPFYMLSN